MMLMLDVYDANSFAYFGLQDLWRTTAVVLTL
jgi:hypothetical protein